MYSFDHDIGSFVAIGTGTVSDDGQLIRSKRGGWGSKGGLALWWEYNCGGVRQLNVARARFAMGRIVRPTQRKVITARAPALWAERERVWGGTALDVLQ